MHSKPGSIVIGVDGSEPSNRALKWGAEQAAAEHRPVTLVHTIDAVSPTFLDAAIVDTRDSRTLLDVTGQAVLDKARALAEEMAPGLEIHQVFDLVDPRQALIQLSGEAHMIVVGSRGRGPLKSLLLGSVGVALVRHATCPVVVIRPGDVGTVRDGILVGVDTSEDAGPVLDFAFRQAALHSLPLTVLHCRWDLQEGTAGPYPLSHVLDEEESERLGLSETTAGMSAKYPDVPVRNRIAKGFAESALAHASETMDLVVLGAHQRGLVPRTFSGSVSASVVEHARCPVAVVPLESSAGTS